MERVIKRAPLIPFRRVARRVLPDRLVAWLRRRLNPAVVSSVTVPRIRSLLSSAFGPNVQAIEQLEAVLLETGQEAPSKRISRVVRWAPEGSALRLRALLALARRDYVNGDLPRALDRMSDFSTNHSELRKEADLFRVDCLFETGDVDEAMTLLSRMTGRQTQDPDLLLRVSQARSMRNAPAQHGSGPMAEGLNRLYHEAGFGLIRRVSVVDPPGIQNLAADVDSAGPDVALARVSVIVPIASGHDFRAIDLSSLVSQSWGSLEILIVVRRNADLEKEPLGSDAEGGRILSVVVHDGADDDLLAAGASQATGELLTTHEVGSWEHPQRIEAQATGLLGDPNAIASISSHLRVDAALRPRPLGLAPRVRLIGENPGSVMVKTSGLRPGAVAGQIERLACSVSPITNEFTPSADAVSIAGGVPLVLSLATPSPGSRLR